MLQKTERDNLKKETQKMKEIAVMENKFSTGTWGAPQNSQNNGAQQTSGFSQGILSQDPTKKVINLGVVGNAKKRPAEEPSIKKAGIEAEAIPSIGNVAEKENINISTNHKENKAGERLEVVTKFDEEGNVEKKMKLN